MPIKDMKQYLKKYYKQYPHTIDDYFVPGE